MKLNPKTYTKIHNAWLRHTSEGIYNSDIIQQKKFEQYIEKKSLDCKGDIYLDNYAELKHSDIKDFFDEAIR
jgi:hypothetical protein